MTKLIKIIAAVVVVFCNTVWAHGTDALGPHQGYVQMPGAFHTEVVPSDEKSISVYLLDMEFKNATNTNSSIEAKIVSGRKTQLLTCLSASHASFRCQAKESLFKHGKLVLKANREGAQGNEISYDLPLALNKHSGMKTSH